MDRHARLLILATVGFVVAIAGAGIVIAIGLFGLPGTERPLGFILFVVHWTSVLAGMFAFLPWAFAAMFAAIFVFRSPAYWLAVGCGIAGAGYLFGGIPGGGPASWVLAVHLLAGVAGGFLFWLIGVRAAGLGFASLVAQGRD